LIEESNSNSSCSEIENESLDEGNLHSTDKYIFKPLIEFENKKGRINMSKSNKKELFKERK
jgi:hypothetical protein